MTPEAGSRDEARGGNGVSRSERREQKRRRRMSVHGRSLEAIMNAIRARARKDDDGARKRKRRR